MDMIFINGTLSIGEVSIDSMDTSSVLMAGELIRVSLVSCFETPPEQQPAETVNPSDGATL